MVERKGLLVGVVALAVIVVLVLTVVLSYNSLISKDQNVNNKWSNIEVEIQRQVELVPQLLQQENVSMYFEQGLLENITSLRTQWLNTMADRSVNEQVNFSTEFMVQMGAFMSVVESYPAIQSTDTIRDIIVSLEGTQNRIAAARIFYNDAVNEYNTAILSFPNNMLAGTFGFEQASYFQQGQ
ncbi:MAG: LemA family protein [Methanomassiliicoccus sp.]|jgi:LemA protein|nr:LemA family protein [Methanomassiliicoccus sp.]